MDTSTSRTKARTLGFQTQDVDEARSFFSSHYAPVQIAPGAGTGFSIEVRDAITIGGVCFSRTVCRSGIDLLFESQFDGYGLTLPDSGSFELNLGSRQRIQPAPRSGLMVDSFAVTRATFLPETNWQRIAISTDAMHQRLQAMTQRQVAKRVRFDPNVLFDSNTSRTMRAIMEAVRIGTEGSAPLMASPAAMASLREAVVNLALETIPHSYSAEMARQSPTPSPRQVRRAIEFMHSNAAMPLRLEDIADAAETSCRALQQAFQRFRGVSPMQYLRQVRLDGARLELQVGLPGTTVAEVAYRWGFPHPGLFSTHYAKAFGETPSTTLRQGHLNG